MSIEESQYQDARVIFQTTVQNAAIDLVEKLSGLENISPGTIALRETASFLGDVMFRIYEGTEVPSNDFKTHEDLAAHIFEYCSNEVGTTFHALLGKNKKIMDIHPTHETPQ